MAIYHDTNKFLAAYFRKLEGVVPSPVSMKIGQFYRLRYKKEHQCLEIAIIQKLARYISGLNASLLLLEAGFTQELGAIFRTLDEFSEDIIFMALPITGGVEMTQTRHKYLEEFFQEEFDNHENPFLSTQKREPIPRKKIRAAVAQFGKNGLNLNDSVELSRTLSQAYSGYVHGASGHILEMIVDESFTYCLTGMPNTFRQKEFKFNYWDYAYRGIMSGILAAKVLRVAELVDEGYAYIQHFEKVTGDHGYGDPEKMMQRMKKKGKQNTNA